MINRILMELYDEYEKDNYESIIEFANKTFPKDETDKLFIWCILILFSRAKSFKPRYSCTREALLDIVLSAKEKIDDTNLLYFYIDRVNEVKGINKYLKEVLNDKELNKYADTIIEYLNQFKPSFIIDIKKIYNNKNN